MDTSSSTSTMVAIDPVSSLRAAALSTLKAKRRKPALEQPSPVYSRPPPPSDSFPLDYGQEDNTQDISMPEATPHALISPKEKEPTPVTALVDAQMREEGEISEEEEEEPLPRPKQLPTHPRPLSRSPKPANSLTPEPKIFMEAQGSPAPPQSVLPTPEMKLSPTGSAPSLMDRISGPDLDILKMEQLEQSLLDAPLQEPFEFHPPLPSLGPNRVRPGLEINQEEYDTIKDIILDLLGWAVPVEHLVECGLSKEVIYYVFNELDLRLPDTFDTSDILRYTPETFAHLQQSTLMPPPSIPEKQRRESPDTGKESAREITPPIPIPSLPIVDSPLSADLHDMERRRRQELMARKAAVQASRKQKQTIPLDTSSDISRQNDSIPVVPTETVEDFLKSLGPVQALDTPPAEVIPSRLEEHFADTMILDQIERQSPPEQVLESEEYEPTSVAVSEQFSISSTRNYLSEEHPLPSEAPPTSVDSSTSTFSRLSEPGSGTPPTHPIVAPRRGTKRPVASDFVDFAPTPKRHENSSRMQHTNGFGQAAGITRRLSLNTGFHNISLRRCVIDLSDSEDDGEETHQQPEDQPQTWRDTRTWTNNFPSPAPTRPASSGAMSPAALMQKEMEIRQMRELIAQREEETRLRKLALAKSASATANMEFGHSLAAIAQPAPLKEEDVDVEMAPSTSQGEKTNGLPSPSRESSTPPSSTEPSARSAATSSIDNNNVHAAGPIQNHILDNEGSGQEANVARIFSSYAPSAHNTLELNMQKRQDGTQAQPEGSVDADQNPSPSTQVNWTTTPQVHQEQDARRSQISQIANNSNDFQNDFSNYSSPFESYPLLLSHGRPVSSDAVSNFRDISSQSSSDMYPSIWPSLSSASRSVYTEHFTSPHSSFASRSSFSLPNLKPLKLVALAKLLDPFKRLCQYEIPGGGTCRDEGCEDLHLNKLEGAPAMGMMDPSDQETAEYLFNVMPDSWLLRHHVTSSSRILAALQQVHRRTVNSPLRFEDRITQALESFDSQPT